MTKTGTVGTPLNVFFAIGRFFIPYFTVSLTSLLETNRHLELKVFLIYDFEEVSLLDEVADFVREKYGVTLNLIYQDTGIFKNYRVALHVSINTYLRLLLPDLIPEEIESGLFLDSDIVVTGSLQELAVIEFAEVDDPAVQEEDKYLYAVREVPYHSEVNSIRMTQMGYKTDKYFNAGIMLVNLKGWRAKRISADLLEMAVRYMDRLVYWDQDVLNMYFVNRWGELNDTYNALHMIWKRPKTPLIIHYAGGTKPWNYYNQHPYKEYYFKYLKLTPFKKNKYVDFAVRNMPHKYYWDFRHFLSYLKYRLNVTSWKIKF
jgi:lipopolysaccharide biosynthesis glycosyltransferase